MRAILLLTLTVLGCATDATDRGAAEAATASGGTVDVRTIHRGTQAAVEPDRPKAILARNPEDYPGAWERTIGAGTNWPMPGVDFKSEVVVILLAGSKPTGGYSIEARGARLEGRTLVIDAVVKAPPPDAIVTQAFTSPFAVIAVKARDFDDVRWNP